MTGASGLLLLLSLAAGADAPGVFVEGDATEPTAPVEPPSQQPGIGQIPPDVVSAARSARNATLPRRMRAVSDALLDRPYESDPLGEGQGVDADPFARYDAFDCLTFLEEVLALALAPEPEHAADVRNALRYGSGPRTYAGRRHFMELQWVPGNIEDGWLVDTTAEYGTVVELHRDVTLQTWKSWGRRVRFAHADDELPVGPMELDVLPLARAREVVDAIRPGSLILTVRVDRPPVPIWVTHVGFVLPDAERPTVRHSTKMGKGSSRDHGLDWYLGHLETYRNWPVLGISILEPVDYGPRRISAEM